MSSIYGLDLSLTGTGVARIGDGGNSVWTERSKGKVTDTLQQRVDRLNDLDSSIRSAIESGSMVAIETPAHNQTSGHHHDRSGLWWLVVAELAPYCQVYEVSTTQVKKYATGKGNASKMEVMAAAIKRYPQFDIANDNEADAVVLAAFLARALGYPLEDSLPQANLSALDKFLPQVGARAK